MTGGPRGHEPTPWDPALRGLTIGLVTTVTLVAFEALAVVTVLPEVAEDLAGLRLYGWATSGFFLGILVGVVIAGSETDRTGPVLPFTAGLSLFAAGLVVAAAAPTMAVLVAGRVLQGLGAGAVPAVLYATIGRAYPESQRPRMFAVTSTAWMLPGLAGPVISALVAERLGWRWVFGGLVPLVLAAGLLTGRALRTLERPTGPRAAAGRGRFVAAVRVSAGAGLALAGLTSRSPIGLVAIVVGAVLAYRPLRVLLPPGTLRARRGIPAAVAARGLLTFAFFGADTFVPLAITDARARSTTVASIAVSTATMTWTAGSWTQARLAGRRAGRDLICVGLVLVAVGTAGFSLVLVGGVPLAVPIICWGISGFGIGMAYSPVVTLVLAETPTHQHGLAGTSVSLSDNLGTALGAGISGVAVATSEASVGSPTPGLAVVFLLTAVVGVAGAVVIRRAPARVFPTSR